MAGDDFRQEAKVAQSREGREAGGFDEKREVAVGDGQSAGEDGRIAG